ncbi:hypothetical protein [Actinoallomurus sp. NPDC050550]|uniref:RICIN domain-containing protein n=1 Tax=Actinoallomurus sp. NPDC050550 TaxID=3154937 RepID=UPI0033C59859
MVYRIHFTVRDLARTRIADRPFPFVELQFAIREFQDRRRPDLDAWRRHANVPLMTPARMVLELAPPVGYSPSFFGPVGAGTPEELLEDICATPRSVIHAFGTTDKWYQSEDSGLCLSVSGASTRNGAGLVQYRCRHQYLNERIWYGG